MIKLSRIDYCQVGLAGKNTLRILDSALNENSALAMVTAVIGDQSGLLHCFSLRSDSGSIDTIHQTYPMGNAKINCLEIIGTSGSPKVVIAINTLSLRGFTRKGKQFFALDLSNLTEPIKYIKLRWPTDIFVCGDYMYNHYLINADNSASGEKGTVVQSKDFFMNPEKITAMILLEDKVRRRTVTVLASKDRLIRLIRESACEFEVEPSGIPTALLNITNPNKHSHDVYFCYGCTDGKISFVVINFAQKPMTPQHKWEIPEQGSKAPVECLATIEAGIELYVGRSDGTVEVWSFSGGVDVDGDEIFNLESAPILVASYNCGESVVSIAASHCGTVLLCCTFTGIVFGLTRSDAANSKMNTNHLAVERDNSAKLEMLKLDCEQLEQKLMMERQRYQEMTIGATLEKTKRGGIVKNVGLSALPYFAINDSFILQEDASYLLSLEVEVAIDAVIVQSDIALDLIDCERNSAVVSFSETFSQEVLATFRCQSNTTRLEIKIRSVEGQCGTLRIYIMTRMTPKSCQVKHYTIKPLSLHKRGYKYVDDDDVQLYLNTLTISGSFSINEGHNWIQQCLPEVPEKVAASKSSSYKFVSTFTDTMLTCEYNKGSIVFQSDNVSTISIIKDFITREATKRSKVIEMNVSTNDGSVSHTLRKLYPKIVSLVRRKQIDRLREAVKEVTSADPDVAATILEDLDKEDHHDPILSSFNLERLYGLITDLYIDHHKLRGSASRARLNAIRSKISDLILLIDTAVFEGATKEDFAIRINQFWGIPPV